MGEEKVKNEAMEIMGLFQVLPRLVVFDLDYTIWPFYCECRSKREMPKLYPQVKGILFALKEKGVDVAIASRSPTADIAKTFLDKLDIKSMFVAQQDVISYREYTNERLQHIDEKMDQFLEVMNELRGQKNSDKGDIFENPFGNNGRGKRPVHMGHRVDRGFFRNSR